MLPPSWKGEIDKSIDEATARYADAQDRSTEQGREIAARIEALTSELERYNSKQEADEPKKRTRENWTTGGLIATAIFTFALASFSLWQVVETRRAYGPIEKSADAARDAADAAKTAAGAASQQVITMQGQLAEMQKQSALTINQLRPKLILTIGGPGHAMKVDGKEGFILTPTWINHGTSDGIDFWGWDNARPFTPDAPVDFDFLNKGGAPIGNVTKVTIAPLEPRLQLSKFISSEDVQAVIDNKTTFVIWGYVEYRESLPGNQPHHIHWCYKVVPVDDGDKYIFSYPGYRPECNTSD
jgi:hypothetical protein